MNIKGIDRRLYMFNMQQSNKRKFKYLNFYYIHFVIFLKLKAKGFKLKVITKT